MVADAGHATNQAPPLVGHNRNAPVHTPYDRYGNRVDEVALHPSWHWLMERAVGHGLQAAPWVSDSPHAHVRRAAAA